MAKTQTIELTISTNYVKDWGLKEAIRELIANALDAERLQDHLMEVEHDEELRQLTIASAGARLQPKHLLLGVSEKGGEESIGRFGEGFKCAVLVLLRLGKSVRFETGKQVWQPRFVKSKTFDMPVLAFDITTSSKEVDAIRITVSGLSAEDWDEAKTMFRFMQAWGEVELVDMVSWWTGAPKNQRATVVKDTDLKGFIYVGGVYVGKDPDLLYGYDLPPTCVRLDRDRRAVNIAELGSVFSEIHQARWLRAVEKEDAKAITEFWDALSQWPRELQALESWASDKFHESITAHFAKLHGEDALAVSAQEDMDAAIDLNEKAVFVPLGVKKVIRQKRTLDDARREKASDVKESFRLEDLTDAERRKMETAWSYVAEAANQVLVGGLSNVEIQAAHFISSKVLGRFTKNMAGTVTIMISRTLLQPDSPFGQLVVTMIHEAAHVHNINHGPGMLDVYELITAKILDVALVPDAPKVEMPVVRKQGHRWAGAHDRSRRPG
jgi:hypothetical protein